MKGCTYRLGLDELLNRKSGLLPLVGSDGEPAGPDGGDNKDGDQGDKSGDKSNEPGDGDKGKDKAEPTPDQKRIGQLEEEKQRFYDQREEARREIKSLKSEIAQLKKDGTPDEALKTSNDELTSTNESLVAENKSLMLENAFLKASGYDWVDPEAALKLADLTKVEFEGGKAHGLESALSALAKAKPFLLKPKADDKGDEQQQQRQTGKPPAGGGQQKQVTDAAAREAKLRAKYPALRR
jgi:hypothetical protein